jgi:putative FmdB family regulatory protein
MPTYDYRCSACDHEFEEFQSISAKPLRRCPVCGKPKLQRLIGTGAGVIFKGSGFWQTDYRSESYKKGEKADAPEKAESKSGQKPEKSDTPAAAAEAKPAEKPAAAEAKPAAPAKKEPGKKRPHA